MEIEDFSFLKCINCGHIIIIPISYNGNHTLLSNMCNIYNELYECCNDSGVSYGSVKYGIEEDYIKLSDLPLALRKEFPPEVTYKFECGKHSLVVTKSNGDKITIGINGNDVIVDDCCTTKHVYTIGD